MSMDKSIGSATFRVSKKITRIVNHFLNPYQITTEQWSVLRTLHENNRISQKELALKTDKDQATLTKILDLLEKNQFVKRKPNPEDRRSYLIATTEKGQELVIKLKPLLEQRFSSIVEGIETEKLAVYQEVLQLLENNIEGLLRSNEQE